MNFKYNATVRHVLRVPSLIFTIVCIAGLISHVTEIAREGTTTSIYTLAASQ